MNSTSKQCDLCDGEGWYIESVGDGSVQVQCQRCASTGRVPAADPPTAGSGSPAGFQPALRSLSVPPNVEEVARRLIEEARRRELYYSGGPRSRFREQMMHFHVGKVAGLIALLDALHDTEDAGPEANEQG